MWSPITATAEPRRSARRCSWAISPSTWFRTAVGGLLTTAVERGAPHEQTLPVLHRIGLLDLSTPGPVSATVPLGRWRRSSVIEDVPQARLRLGPVLVVACAIGVASFVLARTDARTDAGTPVAAFEATLSPLPVPAPSEAYLARAEAFYRAGKLADALAALDRVDAGDGHFRDAQGLRGRVQRAMLGVAAGLAGGGTEPVP